MERLHFSFFLIENRKIKCVLLPGNIRRTQFDQRSPRPFQVGPSGLREFIWEGGWVNPKKKILNAFFLAIYQLCQSIPGTAQGQTGTSRDKAGTSRDKAVTNRDKQGQSLSFPACPYLSLSVPVCPCLSLSVSACPCLSLSVPVCPCLSLSVPVRHYICYICMSTPADEYNSLRQYKHSHINFPCKSHCSNACKPWFKLSLHFSSCFLNNSFITSEQFYSSDIYHKRLHLVSFKFCLFGVNQCNK